MGQRNSRLSFLDLFCGCGGLTRGFVNAGFKVEAGYDNDPQSCATYAANFGEDLTHLVDVTNLSSVERVDVVVGGPPCQGFSNLGRKDPDDERNKLWETFVDVVVASECRVFVLENVDRFAKSAEWSLLRREVSPSGRLEGWSLQPYSLNAADFGVPQRRTRSITIGTRIGPVLDPAHTHARRPSPDMKPWRSVRDALIGLQSNEQLPVDLPQRNVEFFNSSFKGPYGLHDLHVGRTYRKVSIERYGHIAPGRNRFDLPEPLQMECWKRHRTGAADVLGRLEWEKPSVTIRTEFFKPEKGRYLHPEWNQHGRRVNRAISHAEAAALQGFGDDHVWCGTKVAIARQIGNAVPPPLAMAVASAIGKTLERVGMIQ